jgi:hypothetical protein
MLLRSHRNGLGKIGGVSTEWKESVKTTIDAGFSAIKAGVEAKAAGATDAEADKIAQQTADSVKAGEPSKAVLDRVRSHLASKPFGAATPQPAPAMTVPSGMFAMIPMPVKIGAGVLVLYLVYRMASKRGQAVTVAA